MPQFNRPFPPPPPNRPFPPQQQTSEEIIEVPSEEQEKKSKKLSPKTKFGLFIAGGVASFAVAITCLVLIFIL